jgi:hypothetical protein
MSTNPTITLLEDHGGTGVTHRRYRIEGGEPVPEWAKMVRAGQVAWCEISVWGDGEGRSVGSYGGEVWPTAWPHLFAEKGPRSSGVRITEAGLAALDAAQRTELAKLGGAA